MTLNAEIFAQWLAKQGFRVERTASSFWVNSGPGIYQAFPYHWIIQPTKDELSDLFSRTRAIAIRYSTPIQAAQGKISYHVLCETKGFNASHLHHKARQNVQRGLKYAAIERISLKQLATEGWKLRQETLVRQGRSGAENEKWWQTLCLSAEEFPGIEAWGAFHDNQLVSCLLAICCDGTYIFLYAQSATEHLEFRINNAIYYHVAHYALQQDSIFCAFLGLNSLDAPASVDEFKFRMGFMPKPIRQHVVFHPRLARFAGSTTHRIVARLLKLQPHNYLFAKAEGMLRFHVQGKIPLQEQDWPECLLNEKKDICQAALIRT
jgi:hypothetical protein